MKAIPPPPKSRYGWGILAEIMNKEIFERYIKKMQKDKMAKLTIYLSGGKTCNINVGKDKINTYTTHIEIEKAPEYGYPTLLIIPYTSVSFVEINR